MRTPKEKEEYPSPESIREFHLWLRFQPFETLLNWICDAFWKRTLFDTDLHRAFLLYQNKQRLLYQADIRKMRKHFKKKGGRK